VEPQRNVPYRSKVDGDLLTYRSIAPRRAHDEYLILVGERDGGAIDLELRRVSRLRDIFTRDSHQPLFPRPKLFVVEGVGERQHRSHVFVLGKLALWLSTYSKRGRIGTETLRKASLELLELAEESVVLGVRNRRTVEDVVLVGSAREQNAQLGGPLMFLLRRLPRWL